MQTLLIYDSQCGNTEQIARAIAAGLAEHGRVEVLAASEVLGEPPERPGLLLVGGPTQRHGLSPALRAFLAELSRDSLRSTRAASFDTRYHMAAVLTGSAASQAAGQLRRAGCRLVAAPESFFVERDRPPRDEKRRHGLERLEAGELERATEWGRSLGISASAAGSRSTRSGPEKAAVGEFLGRG
jgi:flavodoxin